MRLYDDLKSALRQGNLYDFISESGEQFSKDELIRIIKDLDFTIYENYGVNATTKIENQLLENLDEWGFFE